MRQRADLLGLSLCLGLAIVGWSGGAASQEVSPSLQTLQEAIQKVEAGALEEAIALLEPLAEEPGVEPPVLAFLGALYLKVDRPEASLRVLEPLAKEEGSNPAVLYNAGRAAAALGRIEEAREYLQRSVEQAPASPAARELGLLLAQQGECVDALVHLRTWVGIDPNDAEARLAGAFCAVRLERVPDAEELLSDLPQDNPRVRLLWGKVLLMKGDPWGAIATLKPMLEDARSEHALEARRGMAEAYTLVGQAAQAVELLKDWVGGDPSLALQLGQAQYQSGDVKGALQTLEPFAQRLLEMRPDQREGPADARAAKIALEYGRLLIADGRHAEAVPFLEMATRLDPGNKLGWQGLGQALAAVGRTEEAKAALERFREITHSEVPVSVQEMQLERDVEDPTGRGLREAVTLLGQGRPEEALEIVRREMRLAPDDIRPRLLEVRVLLFLGRPEEAFEVAETAVEMAPESADAYYQRGAAKMALGDLPGGEADLRKALELAPEHTAAMNDLAVLLMEKGENGEAQRLLERVLELRPEDALAAKNLEYLKKQGTN